MSELYPQLRSAIESGELAAGEWLVEASLAQRYGVSRTPVREALRRLEQDGLVERGERGLQVRARSPEEILEIYEVRIMLEGHAASLAAVRRSALDLARLERAAEIMEQLESPDPAAQAQSNLNYHQAIWRSSHNATLMDMLHRLQGHLTRYPATTLSRPGRWLVVLEDHRQLVEAIREGQAERAQQLAEAHIAAARDIRLKMYGEEELPDAWQGGASRSGPGAGHLDPG